MLSAVAHDNHAGYYGPNETFGHPSDKWGWAIQGALSVKAPMLGPGDVFNMQAVYTDGASRYNFQSLFPSTIAMFGGTGVPGAYQSIGFASIADAVFTGGNGLANSGLETVKTWGFRGGYSHNWNPYWVTAIYGGYGALDYGPLATNTICVSARSSLGLTRQLQPRLQRRGHRWQRDLDPGQEPCFHGRRQLDEIGPEVLGHCRRPTSCHVCQAPRSL